MSRSRMQLALALLLAGAPIAGAGGEPQRLKPPPGISCPRDHLTVYSGRVLRYRRAPDKLVLRIRTDWGTDERVTLKPRPKTLLQDYLLLGGKPFAESDWKNIESAPGRLRPRMRVAAWVCDDGRPPVIDWQPEEKSEPSQKPR